MLSFYVIDYFIIEVVTPLYLIFDLTEKGYFIKLPREEKRMVNFFVHPPTLQPRNRHGIIEEKLIFHKNNIIPMQTQDHQDLTTIDC